MFAAVLILLATTAKLGNATEAEVDHHLADARKLDMASRIARLSELFIDTPYGEQPLGEGEGREPQPRWRLDVMDCQTLVETVLAMANANSVAEAKLVLDDIRYASPNDISFGGRNHFFEAQWVPAALRKGYLREAVRDIDGGAPQADLVLKRSDWPQKAALRRLAPVASRIPEGRFSIRYLPLEEARAKKGEIEPGTVLATVREASRHVVRVTHMGFVLKTAEGIVVRHAGSDDKRVLDEPFDDFIKRQERYKWRVIGIALYAPKDAKARATKVTARTAD